MIQSNPHSLDCMTPKNPEEIIAEFEKMPASWEIETSWFRQALKSYGLWVVEEGKPRRRNHDLTSEAWAVAAQKHDIPLLQYVCKHELLDAEEFVVINYADNMKELINKT